MPIFGLMEPTLDFKGDTVPETPPFEPLTPPRPRYESPDEVQEAPSKLLYKRLRLPLLLTELSAMCSTSGATVEALTQQLPLFSHEDRLQLRSFAQSLLNACSELDFLTAEKESTDDEIECLVEASQPTTPSQYEGMNQREKTEEREEYEITEATSSNIIGRGAPCTVLSKPTQVTTLQQSSSCEAVERIAQPNAAGGTSMSNANPPTALKSPERRVLELTPPRSPQALAHASIIEVASRDGEFSFGDEEDGVEGTTLLASPSTAADKLEEIAWRSASPNSCEVQPDFEEATATGDDTSPTQPENIHRWDLADQSIDDFINESFLQIKELSCINSTTEANIALLDSLTQGYQEALAWSDGSQWAALVENGFVDRNKGTIRHVLQAVAFAKWHSGQVKLVEGSNAKNASQEVSQRVLGHRIEGELGKKAWERRRKNLSTHLTRGRKWVRLTEELGYGILFKNPWYATVLPSYFSVHSLSCRKLAKSTEGYLQDLILRLKADQDKMSILQVLSQQLRPLLETGRTDLISFQRSLEDLGMHIDTLAVSHLCEDVEAFYKELTKRNSSAQLYIQGPGFHLNPESVLRLKPEIWFKDDIIVACLHLSDKLPFVRAGFCIPIHQQLDPRKVVARPFQMASKRIDEWHSAFQDQIPLVYFFPLLQNNNHFSLLEINEREGCIFHYDSLSTQTNLDVKVC